MNEIKRYCFDDKVPNRNDKSGPVVSYDDHTAIVTEKDARIAALQEQVRALAAENKCAIDAVTVFSNVTHEITEIICDEIGQDKVAEILAAYNDIGNTPATDAALREIRAQARAEGIHFAANRLLAAWETGFIDDTPAAAHDISGAILSAVEFLPNADEAEFKRDYADEVRARIREGEQP
ncbi:hypothetical protein [Erwinia aphidicola]|uniref:hypothetical protein n=1 Tax=Erwinia aphidicola TaxID=68334 RepID=UPI00209D3EF0|nr:hypothetical protein [Erwinia aphidicola]MCP2232846.1 uncharacterized small protein (DUF1192 family) [Erwinia aphidicola]